MIQNDKTKNNKWLTITNDLKSKLTQNNKWLKWSLTQNNEWQITQNDKWHKITNYSKRPSKIWLKITNDKLVKNFQNDEWQMTQNHKWFKITNNWNENRLKKTNDKSLNVTNDSK